LSIKEEGVKPELSIKVEDVKPELSILEDAYESGLAGLIGKVASEDHAALAQLYDETNRVVFGLACRIIGDREAAEEVTLDVFTYVWRQASRYQPDRGVPSSWLLMLTHSRSIDCVRARARRGIGYERELVFEQEDSSPDPETNAIFTARREKVQRALAQLPREEREAIELAYFSGLSQSEISEGTGVALGTVKSRIRVGMTRLRQSLKSFEGDYGS
jgi:RNA polymerase sigma-70 factor, ECF subfamily